MINCVMFGFETPKIEISHAKKPTYLNKITLICKDVLFNKNI
jgi:hypothetical protein